MTGRKPVEEGGRESEGRLKLRGGHCGTLKRRRKIKRRSK